MICTRRINGRCVFKNGPKRYFPIGIKTKAFLQTDFEAVTEGWNR